MQQASTLNRRRSMAHGCYILWTASEKKSKIPAIGSRETFESMTMKTTWYPFGCCLVKIRPRSSMARQPVSCSQSKVFTCIQHWPLIRTEQKSRPMS